MTSNVGWWSIFIGQWHCQKNSQKIINQAWNLLCFQRTVPSFIIDLNSSIGGAHTRVFHLHLCLTANSFCIAISVCPPLNHSILWAITACVLWVLCVDRVNIEAPRVTVISTAVKPVLLCRHVQWLWCGVSETLGHSHFFPLPSGVQTLVSINWFRLNKNKKTFMINYIENIQTF